MLEYLGALNLLVQTGGGMIPSTLFGWNRSVHILLNDVFPVPFGGRQSTAARSIK